MLDYVATLSEVAHHSFDNVGTQHAQSVIDFDYQFCCDGFWAKYWEGSRQEALFHGELVFSFLFCCRLSYTRRKEELGKSTKHES